MTIAQTEDPTPRKPLRLWPGVVAVALLLLARFGLPIVVPEALPFGVIGEVLGGLAIVVWWAFCSRATRFERWGAIVLMIVALGATSRIPRVDCNRSDGDVVPPLGDPGPEPRLRRVGGGQPRSLGRASARDNGRDHPARLWSVGARPDRWLYRQLG